MYEKIDFYVLTKDLNEEATKACYDLLQSSPIRKPFFNFITRETVRPIDIAEILSQKLLLETTFENYVADYAEAVKSFLENYVSVDVKSRAGKYKEKGLSKCDSIIRKRFSFGDLLDLTMVFLCFARECGVFQGLRRTVIINDIKFSVSKEDVKVIQNMRNTEIPVFGSRMMSNKNGRISFSQFLPILYVLYCDLMQLQGEFPVNENGGSEND